MKIIIEEKGKNWENISKLDLNLTFNFDGQEILKLILEQHEGSIDKLHKMSMHIKTKDNKLTVCGGIEKIIWDEYLDMTIYYYSYLNQKTMIYHSDYDEIDEIKIYCNYYDFD